MSEKSSDGGVFNKLEAASAADSWQREIGKLRERLEHYQEKSKQASEQVHNLLLDRGHFREIVEDLKRSIVAADRWDRVYVPTKPDLEVAATVAKISDWQIGEVIKPDETEGFGEFNWSIAQNRVFRYASEIINSTNMHRRAGYGIDTCHIFSEADHVSGNIHYELEVTNEFPAPVATANAGLLLGEVIARLAANFAHVVVHEMSADNHGRMTKKNQWKQGAYNNWSWLVHVIANQYLAKHDNVQIVQGHGTKLLANVLGHKFLLQHGHSVKSWNGIPYYGLERERAREATRRMGTDKEFDYISCGHWHVPGWACGNILINGNLPGTTEFDHSCGRNSPPSQVSFFVSPHRGVFDFTPWRLA